METRFTLGLVVVLALAVGIGILLGRNQGSFASPAPTPPPTALPVPPPNVVYIAPNPAGNTPPLIFDPAVVTVKVGQKVGWGNLTTTPASVTADNGAFNSDVLGYHQIFIWTAKKAGTYTYSSFTQPEMHGTLIVQK